MNRPRPALLLAALLTLPVLSSAVESRSPGSMSGELKQWHKVTLTLDGPFARERDTQPNPFVDYRLTVRFAHESGEPSYDVPGYFAADGDAGETSAEEGTKWRAHLSPDKPGRWTWRVSFVKGPRAAVDPKATVETVPGVDGATGSFTVLPTDKNGRDFRAQGRCSTSASTISGSPATARTSSRPAPTRRRRSSATRTSTAPSPRGLRSPSRPGRPTCATGGPATRRGRTARARA